MLDVSRAQRLPLQMLRHALVLAVVVAACSSEQQGGSVPESGIGGSGGAAGADTTGGVGGGRTANASTTGSSSTATGSGGANDDSDSTSTGGAGGEFGTTDPIGSTGSTGSTEGPPELVDICVRLTNPTGLAGTLALEFDLAVDQDCRIQKFLYLYALATGDARSNFLNALARFNLSLWGCGAAPPSQFLLIYLAGLTEDVPPLTQADADALIEDYLAAVSLRLGLSPEEADSQRAYLQWLASGIVSDEVTGYTRSICLANGAGGEGGSPN